MLYRAAYECFEDIYSSESKPDFSPAPAISIGGRCRQNEDFKKMQIRVHFNSLTNRHISHLYTRICFSQSFRPTTRANRRATRYTNLVDMSKTVTTRIKLNYGQVVFLISCLHRVAGSAPSVGTGPLWGEASAASTYAAQENSWQESTISSYPIM